MIDSILYKTFLTILKAIAEISDIFFCCTSRSQSVKRGESNIKKINRGPKAIHRNGTKRTEVLQSKLIPRNSTMKLCYLQELLDF